MREIDKTVFNCPCCEGYWKNTWNFLEEVVKVEGEYIQLYCPTCSVKRDDMRETLKW